MATRQISNGYVTVAMGPWSALTDYQAPTDDEANALHNASSSTRWDGYDLGMQASDQVDDRSLADDAGYQERGFDQFGGSAAFYYPEDYTDTTDEYQQTWAIVKREGTELAVIERVGQKKTSVPFAPGDWINVYHVETDGWSPDTSDTGKYAYEIQLEPRGDVQAYALIADNPKGAITLSRVGTGSIAVGGHDVIRGVLYNRLINTNGTWSSSAPSVIAVSDAGVITRLGAGTATISLSHPAGTTGTLVIAA